MGGFGNKQKDGKRVLDSPSTRFPFPSQLDQEQSSLSLPNGPNHNKFLKKI
jgi:hypothetical protein